MLVEDSKEFVVGFEFLVVVLNPEFVGLFVLFWSDILSISLQFLFGAFDFLVNISEFAAFFEKCGVLLLVLLLDSSIDRSHESLELWGLHDLLG